MSLVPSVGQGMGPGFLGRGGRAQLRPPLGARPPSLSRGLLLVGSGGCRAERPQAGVLPSGLCPQPQAHLVSCWANPGAVTAQGPVGAALLPRPRLQTEKEGEHPLPPPPHTVGQMASGPTHPQADVSGAEVIELQVVTH